MTRRDFVRMLALLAAGVAAMPEQIAAFEKLYEINTPPGLGPFIAIDEIVLCGMAGRSAPVYLRIFRGNNLLFPFGINAFGGMFRWCAMPDQKIVGSPTEFGWEMEFKFACDDVDEWVKDNLTGHISYLAQDGRRKTKIIERFRDALE